MGLCRNASASLRGKKPGELEINLEKSESTTKTQVTEGVLTHEFPRLYLYVIEVLYEFPGAPLYRPEDKVQVSREKAEGKPHHSNKGDVANTKAASSEQEVSTEQRHPQSAFRYLCWIGFFIQREREEAKGVVKNKKRIPFVPWLLPSGLGTSNKSAAEAIKERLTGQKRAQHEQAADSSGKVQKTEEGAANNTGAEGAASTVNAMGEAGDAPASCVSDEQREGEKVGQVKEGYRDGTSPAPETDSAATRPDTAGAASELHSADAHGKKNEGGTAGSAAGTTSAQAPEAGEAVPHAQAGSENIHQTVESTSGPDHEGIEGEQYYYDNELVSME